MGLLLLSHSDQIIADQEEMSSDFLIILLKNQLELHLSLTKFRQLGQSEHHSEMLSSENLSFSSLGLDSLQSLKIPFQ